MSVFARRRFRCSRIVVTLVVLMFATSGFLHTETPPKAKKKELWDTVVVIGASASAGFDPTTFSGGVTLANALDEMIRKEHTVVDAADFTFFMRPEETALRLLKQAHTAEPSVVVAVDFLFWFAYGTKSPEQRVKNLQVGLEMLEGFDCPILISRLPDMSPSIGKMLRESQVPKPDELVALNELLEVWSKKHKNVVVVPVVEFLNDAREGKAVTIGKAKWPADSKRLLLHADELHPTTDGIVALAYLTLHQFDKENPRVKPDDYDHAPQDLAKKLKEKPTRKAG